MDLEIFHPAVARWFTKTFSAPTEPQIEAWPAIKDRSDTLIAAPTGSGKTLAAFLAAIDDLVWLSQEGRLDDTTHVVYVSPLKALSNDIQRNLQIPLEGILNELKVMGLPEVPIRTLVRTGDTPAAERTAMSKRPPHIVVTTPESLYLLLTSEGGRRILQTTQTLILDEIHALVGNKRGSHLALSVERLQELVGHRLVRIGLSATQRPIEAVARYLVGAVNVNEAGSPRCKIINTGHTRRLDLAIEVPASPLQAVMSGEVWDEVYDRLAALISEHRTTLVFVNTRRLAERVSRHLGERLGDENVAAHHGSLAREQRLAAEQRLKAGELRALVATASLELGIDIGDVNLVCQIGSTRSIASFLQRVGRSNHTVAGFPKGRIFPLSRDELVECTALIDSVRRGELDQLSIPEEPLDILAQQLVASVATEEWTEDRLFAMVRRSHPYRKLSRHDFDAVLRMLSEGFSTKRGRRSAYIHHDAVNHRLRGRRGARLAAITSGGAIPDTADYAVVLEPNDLVIGSVNEDFAIESLQGDIFQLGNASWRVLRVEQGKVRVEDAHGQPPSIPFWLGEAPARTAELSASVSRLREEIAQRIPENLVASGDNNESNTTTDRSDSDFNPFDAANKWLMEEVGISRSASDQIVEYLGAAKVALGVMPTLQNIVIERFFDESGSMQLVLHSPFGSRLNRAWGLALRKRFCRQFNFELQAAATEDAIVLSLGPTHSFPLDDVFHYLNSKTVRELLCQALLDAPMWNIRWRWNVSRALAVLRRRGGRKIPAQLQRMEAEDLLTAIFPDQVACAENLSGQREIPTHPLVAQTIRDCLEEAMDIDGLETLLQTIERGEKNLVSRDLLEPSPLAQEILNARPYAYLDDAPLEERRTRAVYQRRWLSPESAAEIGKLDQAAIDRVRRETWPDVQNSDELHDSLMELGFITEIEGLMGEAAVDSSTWPIPAESSTFGRTDGWGHFLSELESQGRATVLQLSNGGRLWSAAERLPQLKAVYSTAMLQTPIDTPESFDASWSCESALVELLRGRLETLGPVTAEALAASAVLPVKEIEAALLSLEAEGFILRGHFRAGIQEIEWCARRLLARIHRYTLNRLRQEIEPVSSADFIRFLLSWQKVAPDYQVEGPQSLAALIEQLEGFEAPAAAWEGEIFPSRLLEYDPAWLDALCLSGQVVWARLSLLTSALNPSRVRLSGPLKTTPITLVGRKTFSNWKAAFGRLLPANFALSTVTQVVYDFLLAHGASFFADIVEGTSLLRSQVEESLSELVALGLVVSDSFTGLRALLTPGNRKTHAAARRKRRESVYDMANAGRWSILDPASVSSTGLPASSNELKFAQHSTSNPPELPVVEQIARTLLKRYGVIFKRLLDREGLVLPWRDLLRVYRRLEARGEIRGGRFVAGISGEQFALPEAVGMLRSVRRTPTSDALISVSAADPLNLVGIITPGGRVTSYAGNRVLYCDGVAVAVHESGETRFLVEMSSPKQWKAKNALLRKPTIPMLRSYLRRPA